MMYSERPCLAAIKATEEDGGPLRMLLCRNVLYPKGKLMHSLAEPTTKQLLNMTQEWKGEKGVLYYPQSSSMYSGIVIIFQL